MNTILIVGDMFAAFANGCSSLTKEQFFQMSEEELSNVRRIIIGQGIRMPELRFIYSFLAEKCLLSYIEIEEHLSLKISRRIVHKTYDKNVMITAPERLSENSFSSYLVVEDGCAELSDHVTGLHMQGMLFIEAARQMFMAISPNIGDRLGFENDKSQHALKEIQVAYKKFLYPMPIEIVLNITEGKELRRLGIFTSEVNVQFKQFDEVGVEVTCKATTHDRLALTHLEEIGATRQLEKLLANRFDAIESRFKVAAV